MTEIKSSKAGGPTAAKRQGGNKILGPLPPEMSMICARPRPPPISCSSAENLYHPHQHSSGESRLNTDWPRQMAQARLLWTMIVLAGFGTAIPADAKVSASLAKKCQAMAWQAHPATLPNVQAAANLRRNYYGVCVARGGIIDPLDPNKQFRSGEDWSR